MPIFKKEGDELLPLQQKDLDLERDLQEKIEESLGSLFGLEFVESEFQVSNLRIDTLALDEESNSFVIIEYKRDSSFSVVDQGFAYLSTMLNNKADFILRYNENNEDDLERAKVDWSQSRLIFLASSFTKHQQRATNFKDLPIELWEFQKYEDDLFSFNKLKSHGAQASIENIAGDQAVQEVSREIEQYSVEGHFNENWNKSKKLFEELRERIIKLDDRLEENPVKVYIGYKIDHENLVNIVPRKSKLRIRIPRTKPEDVNDPEDNVSLRTNTIENFNQNMSELDVKQEEDIDYAIMIIRQVYKEHFK